MIEPIRRHAFEFMALVLLTTAVSSCAAHSAPSGSESPPAQSPRPASHSAWPVVGHWRPSRLARAAPGLLVVRPSGGSLRKLVAIGQRGSTKATIWRCPELLHFDCDPASHQIVATLATSFDSYEIVLLEGDGTVRRVVRGHVDSSEGMPFPVLLADNTVVWAKERIVGGWPSSSIWWATDGHKPARAIIEGKLPVGFRLNYILPLVGRRSLAMVDVVHRGAAVLADWSAGQLTVRGRPYVRSFARWNLDMEPGGPLGVKDAIILQGFTARGQVRIVRWVGGDPVSRVVLQALPPEPSGGDLQPVVSGGPAHSALLFGWWAHRARGRMPLLNLDLRSGAITRSKILLSVQEGLSGWQWLP